MMNRNSSTNLVLTPISKQISWTTDNEYDKLLPKFLFQMDYINLGWYINQCGEVYDLVTCVSVSDWRKFYLKNQKIGNNKSGPNAIIFILFFVLIAKQSSGPDSLEIS